MFNISQNSQLSDFIKIYKNVVTESQSKMIIQKSSSFTWGTHQWANYKNIVHNQDDQTEFMRAPEVDGRTNLILRNIVTRVLEQYSNDVNYHIAINGFSPINLNQYDPGTLMKPHVDHIYTIFDGTVRGIPILTVLGLLHSDFEGGEFVICNDYEVPLNGGDLIVFPSVFMFPHQVKSITKGKRYSFVTWAY